MNKGARLMLISMAMAVTSMALAEPMASNEFDCLLEPYERVKVGSPVDGVLEKLFVEEGERVTQGDLLAELNADVDRAVYRIASARATSEVDIDAKRQRLKYQERQEARKRELFTEHTISQEEMDKAETETELARLALSQAKHDRHLAELEMARAKALVDEKGIRSPIDGVVLERHLSPGEFVHEQAYVVEIVQLQPLKVTTYLPLIRFQDVQVGGSALVLPNPPIGGEYVAHITHKEPVLDAASQTFALELTIDNEQQTIPGGIKCKVRLQ